MEYPNGEATPNRYAAWFNKWIGQGKHVHNYNGFLNGAQCYGFRCDMLHQGASGKPHRNYDRIVFVLPGAINSTMHLCISRRILLMDLEMFCRDITGAVHAWLATVQGTQPFEAHRDRLVRLYPQGIAPDIVGIPLIG
jgi:hypothetical protein